MPLKFRHLQEHIIRGRGLCTSTYQVLRSYGWRSGESSGEEAVFVCREQQPEGENSGRLQSDIQQSAVTTKTCLQEP